MVSHSEQQLDHNEKDHTGDAENAGDQATDKIDRDGKIKKTADDVGEKQQDKAAERIEQKLKDQLDGRGNDFQQNIKRKYAADDQQDRID